MRVHPKPRSFKGLIAWEEFMDRVGTLSSEQLEAIAADLLERQSAAYPPLAEAIRRHLDAAREVDDLQRELIRLALSYHELTALTSYPFNEKAFPIKANLWDGMALSYHDASRSIEDGIFAISPEPIA
jgi:hypothetical protein